VVVDVMASWCGKCEMIDNFYHKLGEKEKKKRILSSYRLIFSLFFLASSHPNVTFIKIDKDEVY